jgi:hypothetical protein
MITDTPGSVASGRSTAGSWSMRGFRTNVAQTPSNAGYPT